MREVSRVAFPTTRRPTPLAQSTTTLATSSDLEASALATSRAQLLEVRRAETARERRSRVGSL